MKISETQLSYITSSPCGSGGNGSKVLMRKKGAMISRKEIFAYVKDKYNIEPDYPWARTPNYAVLRHATNRKWFGAIVNITEDKLGLAGNELIDALLLKCDPVLIGSLRGKAGILPAYHMNKEHWITVLLDGSCPKEEILSLIDLSYDLTK